MRSQPFIQSSKRISRHVYKMLLLSRHLPPKSDLIDSEASMRSFEKRKPLTDLTNAPSLSGSSATAGDFTNIGKPNHDIAVGDCFDFAVVGINCIPAEKSKRIRGKSKMQGENTAQKRTFSVPHQKSAKKQRCKTSKNMDEQVSLLPQDYVEQQRAYFAEIDAFELPEEEVSTSDLE